jgi:hypothetical protein
LKEEMALTDHQMRSMTATSKVQRFVGSLRRKPSLQECWEDFVERAVEGISTGTLAFWAEGPGDAQRWATASHWCKSSAVSGAQGCLGSCRKCG